jgi:hypothetical protein
MMMGFCRCAYLFIEFYDHAIDFIEPRHSMTADVGLFSSKGNNRR